LWRHKAKSSLQGCTVCCLRRPGEQMEGGIGTLSSRTGWETVHLLCEKQGRFEICVDASVELGMVSP